MSRCRTCNGEKVVREKGVVETKSLLDGGIIEARSLPYRCPDCNGSGLARPHMKYNEVSETTIAIKKVDDLRRLIDGVSGDTKVYLFSDTAYDLCAEIREQECVEHNGKTWIASGLIFEIE